MKKVKLNQPQKDYMLLMVQASMNKQGYIVSDVELHKDDKSNKVKIVLKGEVI